MNESKTNGPLSSFEELCSTDTNDTAKLKELENLLKCGICYEYFNTCVVTDCSHNFCSLCIRKYILIKPECPVCFSELYNSQLRTNRIVDNFVSILPELSDRLIRRIRTLKMLKPNTFYVSPSKNVDHTPKIPPSARKRRILTPKEEDDVDEQTAIFTEPACNTPKTTSNMPNCSSKVVIPTIFQSPVKKSPSTTSKNTSGPTVECPVCSIEISERNINMHLDKCLDRQQQSSERRNANKANKRAYLPKLVVRLMSTAQLRMKAKEYGLNSHGDGETLKSRIQRYTVLYNAELDKINPRPVPEIIRQLEKEEKLLNQKLPKSIFSLDNGASKEELSAQYMKENKTSFDELIKNLLNRKPDENISDPCGTAGTGVKHSDPSISNSDNVRPSTSSGAFSTLSYSDAENKIDIEEMKVEAKSDDDNDDSERLFSGSRKRCKRISESSEEIPFVAVKVEDDCDDPVFDALTDEDFGLNNIATAGSSDDPSNLISHSPVLQTRARRKRRDEEPFVVAKKSLRKRKKVVL